MNDKVIVAEHLKKAGRLWTLSEAYNVRYGKSFYNLRANEDRLHEYLISLKPQELNVIRESIAETADLYKLPEELCRMQFFMDEQFGSSAVEPGSVT